MKYYILPMLLITLFSCKHPDSVTYTTGIGSITYQAQLDYFNQTIRYFSRLSDTGRYYWTQDSILEAKANELQLKLQQGRPLSSSDQKALIEPFEKNLIVYPFVDSTKMGELKKTPITSVSDIDLIKLYIKSCFVAVLHDNRLLPFDTWGTMASADSWQIKPGEEFRVTLAASATASFNPIEWYQVVSVAQGLVRTNIIDTLIPDRFGEVVFKTKNYKKGDNHLSFLAKMKRANREDILSKTLTFTVQ